MSEFLLNMFFCCVGSFIGVIIGHLFVYAREEEYNEFVEDSKND